MNSKRKTNTVVTHELVGSIIRFTVVGAGSFEFDPANCSEETERAATLHGYVQKISDRAAIPRDPKTGASATPTMKLAAMRATAGRLATGGPWNERAATRPTLNRAALFNAVATVRGIEAGVVASRWQGRTDDVLRAALTHPAIAAEYARLTARGGEDESLFEGL